MRTVKWVGGGGWSVIDGRLTVLREIYRCPLAVGLVLQEEGAVIDADSKIVCLVPAPGSPGPAGVPFRGAVVYTLVCTGRRTQP